MRKNSKKQTATSRTNGAKSRGPKSADGKQKSGLNALKDGLFSKDVVVTAAGERVEDFEQLEASVGADVQPDGVVEEMVTHDLSVNWWCRQRVRRCQSAYLQNRLKNLQAHDLYLPADEVEALKLRFQLALERYQATTSSTPSSDLNHIVTELESARNRLASTSLGLESLINKVNAVKSEAQSTGQISRASEVALRACAGLMNDFVPYCIQINWFNKTQSAKTAERAHVGQSGGTGQTKENEAGKSKENRSGGTGEAGEGHGAEGQTMLVYTIEHIAGELRDRKQLLEMSGEWQAKTRLAAAVLPADNTCDRFSRAETAYDRRLYRALAALLALKQAKVASKSLP